MICSDISAVLSAKTVVLGWGFVVSVPIFQLRERGLVDDEAAVFSCAAFIETALPSAVQRPSASQDPECFDDWLEPHGRSTAVPVNLERLMIIAELERVHCVDLSEVLR